MVSEIIKHNLIMIWHLVISVYAIFCHNYHNICLHHYHIWYLNRYANEGGYSHTQRYKSVLLLLKPIHKHPNLSKHGSTPYNNLLELHALIASAIMTWWPKWLLWQLYVHSNICRCQIIIKLCLMISETMETWV